MTGEPHDHVLSSSAIAGEKGQKKTITLTPETGDFQGQKLMAIDSRPMPICPMCGFPGDNRAGQRTMLSNVRIDGKPVPNFHGPMMTMFFAPTALGNGVKLPVCPKDKNIEIDVEFLEDCHFSLSLFGQVVD